MELSVIIHDARNKTPNIKLKREVHDNWMILKSVDTNPILLDENRQQVFLTVEDAIANDWQYENAALTKEKLLELIATLDNNGDVESNHAKLDDWLIDYINDKDIRKAFNSIDRWYA